MSRLASYLARIGWSGPVAADLSTLFALHRAHVLAIPFETIDVQLGKPPGLDRQAIFAKLVGARRGGWCYEQNGLFGEMLETIGFPVTRLSAGVMRAARGDAFVGTHLCLKVRADGDDWLCDVGFGSSQLEPLPLREHAWRQPPFGGRLHRLADGMWQLAIEEGPNPLSYDFADAPANEADFARLCAWQGSDPDSLFVQTLAVQRRTADGHLMLRGKVLTETGPEGSRVRELGSADELVTLLRERFDLHIPEAESLWPRIIARHAAALTTA